MVLSLLFVMALVQSLVMGGAMNPAGSVTVRPFTLTQNALPSAVPRESIARTFLTAPAAATPKPTSVRAMRTKCPFTVSTRHPKSSFLLALRSPLYNLPHKLARTIRYQFCYYSGYFCTDEIIRLIDPPSPEESNIVTPTEQPTATHKVKGWDEDVKFSEPSPSLLEIISMLMPVLVVVSFVIGLQSFTSKESRSLKFSFKKEAGRVRLEALGIMSDIIAIISGFSGPVPARVLTVARNPSAAMTLVILAFSLAKFVIDICALYCAFLGASNLSSLQILQLSDIFGRVAITSLIWILSTPNRRTPSMTQITAHATIVSRLVQMHNSAIVFCDRINCFGNGVKGEGSIRNSSLSAPETNPVKRYSLPATLDASEQQKPPHNSGVAYAEVPSSGEVTNDGLVGSGHSDQVALPLEIFKLDFNFVEGKIVCAPILPTTNGIIVASLEMHPLTISPWMRSKPLDSDEDEYLTESDVDSVHSAYDNVEAKNSKLERDETIEGQEASPCLEEVYEETFLNAGFNDDIPFSTLHACNSLPNYHAAAFTPKGGHPTSVTPDETSETPLFRYVWPKMVFDETSAEVSKLLTEQDLLCAQAGLTEAVLEQQLSDNVMTRVNVELFEPSQMVPSALGSAAVIDDEHQPMSSEKEVAVELPAPETSVPLALQSMPKGVSATVEPQAPEAYSPVVSMTGSPRLRGATQELDVEPHEHLASYAPFTESEHNPELSYSAADKSIQLSSKVELVEVKPVRVPDASVFAENSLSAIAEEPEFTETGIILPESLELTMEDAFEMLEDVIDTYVPNPGYKDEDFDPDQIGTGLPGDIFGHIKAIKQNLSAAVRNWFLLRPSKDVPTQCIIYDTLRTIYTSLVTARTEAEDLLELLQKRSGKMLESLSSEYPPPKIRKIKEYEQSRGMHILQNINRTWAEKEGAREDSVGSFLGVSESIYIRYQEDVQQLGDDIMARAYLDSIDDAEEALMKADAAVLHLKTHNYTYSDPEQGIAIARALAIQSTLNRAMMRTQPSLNRILRAAQERHILDLEAVFAFRSKVDLASEYLHKASPATEQEGKVSKGADSCAPVKARRTRRRRRANKAPANQEESIAPLKPRAPITTAAPELAPLPELLA